MKSKLFVILIVFLMLLGMASVSAEDNQTEVISDEGYRTFTELNQSISEEDHELNLSSDYKYDGTKIMVDKKNEFTINGNDKTIFGITEEGAFDILSDNVVIINNLTFRDCENVSFTFQTPVILNNVNFINCTSRAYFLFSGSNITINNCVFEMNNGNRSEIYQAQGNIFINNTRFADGEFPEGVILADRSNLIVENATFSNISSNLGTAINFKGWTLSIRKSKFMNLEANLSGGVILGKYFPMEVEDKPIATDPFLIEDCEFINVKSAHDGGAVYVDLNSGANHLIHTFIVKASNFTNSKSQYGGAILALGGILNITDSRFINNSADFEGGAMYTSWSTINLVNSTFSKNTAEKKAGAIYFDKGVFTMEGSDFTNNDVVKISADSAKAIYAHDVTVDFTDSNFDNNGGLSVYGDFATIVKLDVNMNNDTFSVDNKNYMLSVESKGIRLNITNNTIIVDKLPSKFDSRDWGWITPLKVQNIDNDDCWAFATVASLEAALLKSTGVAFNLSTNYLQTLQLKYSRVGDLRISMTGFAYSGLGYALSWYGALPMDNSYDYRQMVADTDFDDERVHLQDAMFIYGGQNDTVEMIKWAILRCGAVSVQSVFSPGPGDVNDTGDDIAYMDHGIHFISLIGWDDNHLNSDETVGAWITKDSLGSFGTNPYSDDTILAPDKFAYVPQYAAVAYIFENAIDYHVNYQTDLTALTGFDGNFTSYSNEFISKYDELIGAVGTYFNESGIDYSFDIFVNGQKVHTQMGISEFAGFRTIVLNKYIPIKTGDQFKVVFKSNALPYQAYSRQHYLEGMSLVSADGTNWTDLSTSNKTVCLKVYTVVDDTRIIDNGNVTVDYGNGFFSVKVVTADGHAVGTGEAVDFNINGKPVLALTDNEGIAKVKITEVPGTYDVTIDHNGQTYRNKVTVKLNPADCKITQNKNIKVDYDGSKYFSVKIVSADGKVVASGVNVKFTINGKSKTVQTDNNGVAKIKINEIPKKYTMTTTFNGKSVKNTVIVKQVLKASKVTVKKSAKKFTLKATLKINGKKVKGKKITFKFNGKTYKAKTSKKGIAKVTIKKNVIKKLKKGKKYAVKVTYLKDTIKTTVKVR